MRRGFPGALFAGVTLLVFWKFLLLGHTLHNVAVLERGLGLPEQRPQGWFRPDHRRTDREDSLFLLPQQLRLYNEGLKQGEIRLWNPALFCGYPLYANPVVHPFYPPQMLVHLLFPPLPAYEIFLMLHLFFSGAAMYWLCRGLGRSAPAATAGGLVWMFFGYGSTWFSIQVLSAASVFGPLAVLWLHEAVVRKDLSRGALAAIAMGMILLGSHPQHALLFFLFLLAWLAAGLLHVRSDRRFAVRLGLSFPVLSLGVGLVSILLRLDTITHGYRQAGGFGDLYRGVLEPLGYLPGLVLGKASFPADPFHDGEFTLYAGLAAAALAAAGAFRGFRRPPIRFFAIGAAALLAIVFLQPLAKVQEALPLLNLSYPTRWLAVFGLCLSVLAAHGWDSLAKDPGRAPLVLGLIAGLSCGVLAIGLGPFRPSHGAAIETAIGFGLAAAAAFAARRRPRAGLILGFAALLFELVPPFMIFNHHADPAALLWTPRALEGVDREWRAAGTTRTTSLEGALETSRGSNLLAHHGLESPAGYESIVPTHYLGLAKLSGNPPVGGGRHLPLNDFDSRLLDLASLRYVIGPWAAPPASGYRRSGEAEGLHVYENRSALPRARLLGHALAARDEEEAVRLLSSPSFQPHTTAVLEATGPLPSGGPAGGAVAWIERSPDRLALRVTAERPSILVLSDTDYPGWEAALDGRETRLYRANLAFRAVEVPAGTHEVRFRFRPAPARHGLLGSIASVAACAAAAVLLRPGKKVRTFVASPPAQA
jgi:hypothetical protein